MTTDPQRTMLLRTLKGAPLSCIMAMLLCPDRSLSTNLIADLTGYDRHTTANGLHVLQELNLAQHHSRRTGWLLTLTARQLFLATTDDELSPGGNGKKFPPLGCSSSLILCSVSEQDLKPLPLQQPTNGEIFPPLPQPEPDIDDLTTWLRDHIGCPDRFARLAARAAADREDYEEYTRYQALRWLAYTQSRQGATLTFPGAFIARQLEKGYPCPDSFQTTKHDNRELAWETERAYQKWQAIGDDQP